MSTIATYIKRHRIIIVIDIIIIAIYFVITSIAHNEVTALYSQQEASRWENEAVTNATNKNDNSKGDKKKRLGIKSLVGEKPLPYSQVSAFISPDRMMDGNGISDVRSSLQSTLFKDSRGESQTGGRVWIDAYSSETEISLRKDRNTLSVTAVGVGGDFFQFHPMKLLSGSYIAESDINHDRIVVDENFAWNMFGSNDIVGMQVWLDDSIYFIAGVVEVDKDEISEYAYGSKNRVYMMYDELKKKQEGLSISCYEVVYPNPISNYALNAVRSAYGLSDEESNSLEKKKENPLSFDNVEVIENTKRYNDMELLHGLKYWNLRSMRTTSISYPFWENVARVQEEKQLKLILIRVVLLIFPIISGLWLIYGLWKMKTWTIKGLLLEEIDKAKERKAWKIYEEKMAAEEEEQS